MDFATIKANVRIVDVLAKRGISLRYNGEWGSAVCPLPTHKSGDKDKTFQVNVAQNYWKCWSNSCNEKAGKKGGDVINLVALLDDCSEYNAAKKLADLFTIEKAAEHIAQRPQQQNTKRTVSNHDSPSVEVKGYMADVDVWFDAMIAQGEQESSEAYLHRVRNAIKNRLVESFRAGKKVAQGVPV